MFSLQTERLTLRQFTTDDAEFILRLLNEPSFLKFIGDKRVRNLEDARLYILNGPVASYEKNGFGLYLVELTAGKTPIGMCGLIKRETLSDVDIGFAFLPEFWNKGYALESASATMFYAKDVLKLRRIVAIVNKDNYSSVKLLVKLGLRFDRLTKLTDQEDEIQLFVPDERCPMKLDRIHQVAVFARDLDEAISFYRDTLGAKYLAKFDPPGLVFFDFSGTRILLEKTGPKASVYFRVDDIQAAHRELTEKGVKFIADPQMIFRDDNGMFGAVGEEEWMAFFSDPSDNILALASRTRAPIENA